MSAKNNLVCDFFSLFWNFSLSLFFLSGRGAPTVLGRSSCRSSWTVTRSTASRWRGAAWSGSAPHQRVSLWTNSRFSLDDLEADLPKRFKLMDFWFFLVAVRFWGNLVLERLLGGKICVKLMMNVQTMRLFKSTNNSMFKCSNVQMFRQRSWSSKGGAAPLQQSAWVVS